MNTAVCVLSIRTGEVCFGFDVRYFELKMALSRLVRIFLAILLVVVLTKTTWADEPSVTAVLTSSETEVDRPVQLQIKVSGDNNASPPGDIAVDGLDIRYTGQSQLMEGRNFRFTY